MNYKKPAFWVILIALVITSISSGVLEKVGLPTRNDIWSFEMVNTNVGDFVIINEGVDEWFVDYVDEIYDTIIHLQFTTES